MVSKLLELPVSVQVNAESLTDWRHRRALVKMFSKGTAHVLGSDCHNTDRRKPNLDMGYSFIREKIGQNAVDEIEKVSVEILEK